MSTQIGVIYIMKKIRRFSLISSLILITLLICDSKLIAQETIPQVAKNNAPVKQKPITEKSEADSAITINSSVLEPSLPASSSNSTLLKRVGVQTAQTTSITLNEAIRLALQNNNDIEIARDDVKISELNLRSLEGVFDGIINITPTYSRNSVTGRDPTSDIVVNSDFTRLLESGGGNYRVFFNNSRQENSFAQAQASNGNVSSSGGSALFSSRLGVTFSQPLWRDFKIDNNRRQIKIQRKRIAQSDADFRRRTIEVIAQVQRLIGIWCLLCVISRTEQLILIFQKKI